MKPWLIFFMACATFLGARGAESTWLRLTVPFSFHDKDNECSTGSLGSALFVGVDTEGGKVVAARLGTGSKPKPTASRPLSAAEAAALEVHEDSYHRFWIRTLVLDEGTLVWAINDIGNVLCAPRSPVVSVEASPTRIYFDVDGLGEEYLVSRSNYLKLSGLRKDKLPYALDMHLVQKRYVKESP